MENAQTLNTVNLLGFDISQMSITEAVEYALNLIKKRKGGHIVTINPEIIQTCEKNQEYSEIIKKSDLIIPDGVGIKLGLRLKNIDIKRVAGIEFSYKMLGRCEKERIPVALVGAKPHIISAAVKNLKEDFPNLKIVYYYNGYFSDENRVISELKRSVPNFVLVALGAPKQDYFIQKALKEIPTAVMVGVGGCFDVWSGNVLRAPEFYQKCGLEWLYRTIKEPSRFKRIFPTLPNFVIRVIKEDVLKLR
jgi:N-acetylglucosaminyldiphosphoundecaprenol N-acetyl-beta-D-mannosaminyltransferase